VANNTSKDMKKHLFSFTVIIAIMATSCSKIENSSHNLKQSLNRSITEINNAMGSISASNGYQMLSGSSTPLKSEFEYRDSITLEMIAGIYVFAPEPRIYWDNFFMRRLFKKTGESDSLIVTLPQKLVFSPRYLINFYAPDTVLRKDFRITATEYHRFSSHYYAKDYRLAAEFSLAGKDMGSMEVSSKWNYEEGKTYSSSYNFNDDHSVMVSFQSGDTCESVFSLLEGDKILMKETRLWFGDDFHKKEKQYILTLGNVEIKRGNRMDSIQVFVDGILQQKAGAKIVDSTDTEGSVCYHRDILLTFDDGTTAKLSELLKPVREVMRTLHASMHSMNFARNVVDYIALGIYYHEKH
jgi:hypothetical protein